MIVVSDTGPLAYLISIELSESLPQLYGDVYLPPTVYEELAHPQSPVCDWIASPPAWIKVVAPEILLSDARLDQGEREAISLALEMNADGVLIDEKRGRNVARNLGLKIAGTLAVIVDGHAKELFDGVAALDRLAATNFYASAELLDEVKRALAQHAKKPR
jgi:predicted nucleic acid-binding protein